MSALKKKTLKTKIIYLHLLKLRPSSMFSHLSNCILALCVLLLSECDQMANMKKIAPHTQFFWDLSFESNDLNHPAFKDKTILFVVHGYNNTFDDALRNIDEITISIEKLTNRQGLPLYDFIIGYLWPGYDNFTDYSLAVTHAKALKKRIRKHLLDLDQAQAHIDIMAHSLGNRVLFEALNFQNNNSSNPLIRNFFALAPAIDALSIQNDGSLYAASVNCANVFVFYTDKDAILKLLYPLISGKDALGINKASHLDYLSDNIQFVDGTHLIHSHTHFFKTEALYNFIQKLEHQLNPPPIKAKKVTLLKDGHVKIKQR